jgi:serine/threonine protein kinase
MFTSAPDCDAARLQRLIDDSLSESGQAELARHLDVCPRCRQQLETLTADETCWKQTREFLSGLSEEAIARLTNGDAAEPVSLDFLDASDNPAMLGRLGEYEVLEIIGRGGMGVVLKGYDHDLNRYVAIKVLAPQWASSGAARKRFAREGQAAAAVVHQHVLAIHSVNATHRLPYLVMPFVAGESLQQRLDREGPLAIEEILRIGFQVSEGLAAAHAQGLVHRDIKPANILLEKNVERVLLTDFSLARAVDDASVTRSGVIAGTPQYMSPEQAKGEPIDHRSDLFSLGSVLYAMSTGHPPFRAESTLAILRRICDSEPRPLREINPSIPVWLWAVVASLLCKNSTERIDSAKRLAEILEGCLAHIQQPTVVPLPTMLPKAPHRGRTGRNWFRMGLAVAAAVMLAAGFVVFTPRAKVEQPSDIRQHIPVVTAQLPPKQAESQHRSTSPSQNLDWDDRSVKDVDKLQLGIEQLEAKLSGTEF